MYEGVKRDVTTAGPLVRALDRLDKEVEALSQKAGGLLETLQPLLAQVPENAERERAKDCPPACQSVLTGRVERVASRIEEVSRILAGIQGTVEL